MDLSPRNFHQDLNHLAISYSMQLYYSHAGKCSLVPFISIHNIALQIFFLAYHFNCFASLCLSQINHYLCVFSFIAYSYSIIFHPSLRDQLSPQSAQTPVSFHLLGRFLIQYLHSLAHASYLYLKTIKLTSYRKYYPSSCYVLCIAFPLFLFFCFYTQI